MSRPQGAVLVVRLLQEWLPRQRWFAAKGGGEPVLTVDATLALPPTAEQAGMDVHLVTAVVDGRHATYQVPLSYYRSARPDLRQALLGAVPTADGPVYVYDAPHDPAFVAAWLALVAGGARTPAADAEVAGSALGVLQPGALPPAPHRPSRVLAGEQSNTSVIVGAAGDPDPVILKVFRVLQPGANPDVAVTSVLTAARCANVPRLTGWVEGEWVDPHGERVHGHLTSVSEYLPDSEDAWRTACVAVQTGRSFGAEAEAIGRATAAVHAALAASLPTQECTPAALGELADHLTERLAWAMAAVPALAGYEQDAGAVIRQVRGLRGVARLQRIHGDLHLGQVLDAGARGWVLLDFEGEPLRPLADRNRARPGAPGHRRDAALLRLRRPAHRARPARAGPEGGRCPGVGGRQLCGVPRLLRRRRRGRRAGRRRRAAARPRTRQGALRGGVREPEPAGLGRHPAGRGAPAALPSGSLSSRQPERPDGQPPPCAPAGGAAPGSTRVKQAPPSAAAAASARPPIRRASSPTRASPSPEPTGLLPR